ncbi:MAG: permease-like cell division protein FtsX, partial [Actinomycetales bacterium]
MRATFVASEVGNGLRRNLTMTIAVIITVAVSLGLFGVSLLVRAQVSTMKDFWYDKVEVSIFLCGQGSDTPSCSGGAVTDAQREQIKADLESLKPLVEEVYYESKTEAFARFKEQFKNSPIVDNVREDALPESFRVKLSDPTKYEVVASAFAGRPGIEQVNDQRRILDKFFRLLGGLQVIALIIAGA